MSVMFAGDVARSIGISPGPGAFDARRARDHVDRLSFPRLVGTLQERRAARYILRAMAAVGLSPRRERFAVPRVARAVGARLVLAATAGAVIVGARLGAAQPGGAAACWCVAGLLMAAPWRWTSGLGRRWPTRVRSENLVGPLDDPEAADAPARVVFMAHYDSKSQLLPTGVRVGLVVAALVLCVGLVLASLLASAGLPAGLGGPFPIGMAAALLAILAVLATNVTGNRSPGALDNGTGLGTLLELARTWRPRDGAPLEAVWVATGSEELGLDGARDFLRRHEAWWREKPTLLINLDSVGAGGRHYLAGEAGALRLAGETADRLGHDWSRLRVLGASMDHEPFASRGLSALSLLGDVVGKSLVFHSSRDALGLVDDAALGRAGQLAAQIAWAWGDRPALLGNGLTP